jgi:hypothetical protein
MEGVIKFSLASPRSKKAPPKGEQPDMDRVDPADERSEEELPQARVKCKSTSLAWAIATALASVAWAVANYLIEHEKQRTKVELARLEMEAKKQGASN